MIQVSDSDALIVVDVQNDFCSGGALAVPDADQVIPVINCLSKAFDHVVFSRDWHPDDHCSFSETPAYEHGSWPPHCIQNSPGAEFHGDLRVPVDALIVNKATEADREAYSAFDGTGLVEALRARGVERVVVAGLALDYCVRATVLDAVKAGFGVVLVENATRAVAPEKTGAILDELRAEGVKVVRSDCLS